MLDKKDNIKDIEYIASLLYKESLRRIESNKELIEFLKLELLEKWVLDKDSLFELIRKFKEEKNELY
jgi:hypothetical protein